MRSDFNAYRWNARKEWANKKVMDLQKAEESHDLDAIHRILSETGLSVDDTFFCQRLGGLFGCSLFGCAAAKDFAASLLEMQGSAGVDGVTPASHEVEGTSAIQALLRR